MLKGTVSIEHEMEIFDHQLCDNIQYSTAIQAAIRIINVCMCACQRTHVSNELYEIDVGIENEGEEKWKEATEGSCSKKYGKRNNLLQFSRAQYIYKRVRRRTHTKTVSSYCSGEERKTGIMMMMKFQVNYTTIHTLHTH